MKKKLFTYIAAVCLSASMAFTVYADTTNEYTKGSWSENVYTNSWSDYQITVPTDAKKNNTNIKISGTYYDFMATLPDTCSTVQFSYEDLSQSALTEDMTESEYGDMLYDKYAGTAYAASSTESVDLGGYTYLKIPFERQDSMRQDIYLRQLDSYMMVITTTYFPIGEESINSVLDGIESLSEE